MFVVCFVHSDGVMHLVTKFKHEEDARNYVNGSNRPHSSEHYLILRAISPREREASK